LTGVEEDAAVNASCPHPGWLPCAAPTVWGITSSGSGPFFFPPVLLWNNLDSILNNKKKNMDSVQVTSKTKWTIDPAHSEIGFRVKHLKFANVRGSFKDFSVIVHTTGNNFSTAEIDVRIDPASVYTGIEHRDQHLRSADFFDTENFKEIRFTANIMMATGGEGAYSLEGYLTMRDIKKPVRLDVEFGGIVKDPWGAEKALFTINGKINRKEWGLNYNTLLETGGVLISEDVWIQCEVQLTKQETLQ
jgi:polyisoprenoid-binding protein YceI